LTSQIYISGVLTAGHFSFRKDFPKVLILSILYFLAHRISFFFPDSDKVVMLIWPAGGIGLAAFLLNNKRLWPYLAIAFYISGISADVYLAGRSFLTGFGYMTANIIESIGCAWFIIYRSGDFQNFTRVKEVTALIFGAVLINAFSSCIGAGVSVITRGAEFSNAWLSWFISDGLGILLLGTFIVTWKFNIKKQIAELDQKKIIELTACIFVWSLISILIFYKRDNIPVLWVHPYFLAALITWPAIRLGQRGVTLVLMFLLIIAIFSPAIASGPSPWSGPNSNITNRILNLQIFLGFLATIGFLISAGFSERKTAENAVKESESRLRAVFEASPDAIGVSKNGIHIFVNPAYLKLFGIEKMEQIVGTPIINSIAPGHREIIKQNIQSRAEGKIGDNFYESRCIKMNGIEFDAEFNISTYVLNDEIYSVGNIRDITERKRFENDLILGELKYRALFEQGTDGIFISDPKGNLLDVNQSGFTMIGYTNEEVLKMNIRDFYPPKDQFNFFEAQKALKVGKTLVWDRTMIRKDGSLFPVEISGKILNDGRIQAIVRDVTDRKLMEDDIRKIKKQYDDLVSNIPVGIYLLHTSPQKPFVFQYASPKMAEILGVSVKSIIEDPQSAFKTIHPDDLPSLVRLNQEHIDNPRLFNWEGRAVIKGGIIWLRITAIPKPLENGVVLWNGVVTDITERKKVDSALAESEERFRKVFEEGPIGIAIADLNEGRFNRVNEAMCRLLGYTEEGFKKLTLLDITHPDYQAREIDAIKQLFEGKIQQHYAEKQYLKKNGDIIWVTRALTKIYNSDGTSYALSMIVDITNRKQAEEELDGYRNHLEQLIVLRTEELEITNQELKVQMNLQKEYEMKLEKSLIKEQELNDIKSKFISTTSHEFRTPLTAVLSSAELLQRYSSKWNDDRKNEHYSRIYNSVEYLIKLLDDILTISKTDSGKISYKPESVDLFQLALVCEEEIKSIMTKNHELKFNFNSEEKNFFLDQKLMRFIINNLLTNAVKYSPDGGKIGMTINTNNQHITIEISDEGIGIPPEEIEKIFDSFYRANNVETISGTGLGLAIVKRAVDLHKGEITVSSEPGRGTTFRVKIPQK